MHDETTAAAAPAPFSGDGDFTEWLCEVEVFFNRGRIAGDARRIIFAINLFTGSAHAKWRAQARYGRMRPISTQWQEFKSQMAAALTGSQASNCDLLVSQGDLSISEYTQRFLESRRIHKYIAGLNPNVAGYVISRWPKSLQEAVELAMKYEAVELIMRFDENGPTFRPSKLPPSSSLSAEDIPWFKLKFKPETPELIPESQSSEALPKVADPEVLKMEVEVPKAEAQAEDESETGKKAESTKKSKSDPVVIKQSTTKKNEASKADLAAAASRAAAAAAACTSSASNIPSSCDAGKQTNTKGRKKRQQLASRNSHNHNANGNCCEHHVSRQWMDTSVNGYPAVMFRAMGKGPAPESFLSLFGSALDEFSLPD